MRAKSKKRPEPWTVAQARAHLPELFEAAGHRPQRVFRRRELAAVVVSPSEFAELAASRADTLGSAFAELRQLGAHFESPPRRNRKNAFSGGRR